MIALGAGIKDWPIFPASLLKKEKAQNNNERIILTFNANY